MFFFLCFPVIPCFYYCFINIFSSFSGSSNQTRMVVNNGAIPQLVLLLKSSAIRMVGQAVQILGNIAENGREGRDEALTENSLQSLLELITSDTSPSLIKSIMWASANFVKWRHLHHPVETVKMAVPIFSKMLITNDPQIITHAISSLGFLVHEKDFRIQDLLDSGAVPHIVPLLASSDNTIVGPAASIVALITSGNKTQIDALVNAGVLEKLPALLKHEDFIIADDAILALSNITSGTCEQIQRVIDAGIIDSLLNFLDEVI